jgi:hypothetical protein
MNRALVIVVGDQLYVSLRAALYLAESKSIDNQLEFSQEVTLPLTNALEYLRQITHMGTN